MYGAFFEFRALHDPERYWHKDGIILRFRRYAVIKAQKPGKIHASKSGISAGSSEVGIAA